MLPDGEAEKYKCATPDFTTITIFIMFVNILCHGVEICMYVCMCERDDGDVF